MSAAATAPSFATPPATPPSPRIRDPITGTRRTLSLVPSRRADLHLPAHQLEERAHDGHPRGTRKTGPVGTTGGPATAPAQQQGHADGDQASETEVTERRHMPADVTLEAWPISSLVLEVDQCLLTDCSTGWRWWITTATV